MVCVLQYSDSGLKAVYSRAIQDVCELQVEGSFYLLFSGGQTCLPSTTRMQIGSQ